MSLLSIPRTPMTAPVKSLARRQRNADVVVIDRQTYRDLEIFEAEGGPSLFDLLNRTRTSGGEKALDARMRSPWANADKIRSVQDALRFISAHRPVFDALPTESMISVIEQYLHCGYTVANTRNRAELLFESLALRVTDLRQYWVIAAGVQRTTRLLHTLRRLAFDPALEQPPGDLTPLIIEMCELLDRAPLRSLAGGEPPIRFWEAVRLDRILRLDERPAVDRLLRLLFELDALVAMADTNRQTGFTLPTVSEGPLCLRAEALYHPFITRPVANDLRIDQEKRLLFLTGPNMAGKTTYLRACGTAVYLAHLGMGVPARSFAFAPCDTLCTAISLADNVRQGVSFFRAEAMRVKVIAQALADGRHVIALLDEPFMGTNVKDAVDASRAVLLRLAAAEGSIFLVSSHLMELGAALEATEHVLCCRFDARDQDGRLEYDYVLRDGVSEQRLGLRVLEQEGVFTLLDRIATEERA